jgi:hypothetical protein
MGTVVCCQDFGREPQSDKRVEREFQHPGWVPVVLERGKHFESSEPSATRVPVEAPPACLVNYTRFEGSKLGLGGRDGAVTLGVADQAGVESPVGVGDAPPNDIENP